MYEVFTYNAAHRLALNPIKAAAVKQHTVSGFLQLSCRFRADIER